jgi:hypothetical protein
MARAEGHVAQQVHMCEIEVWTETDIALSPAQTDVRRHRPPVGILGPCGGALDVPGEVVLRPRPQASGSAPEPWDRRDRGLTAPFTDLA